MSNSAVLFVPATRCCARVGVSLRRCLHFCVRRRAHGALATAAVATAAIPSPRRGVMERRQAALVLSVAPATRDPLSRGDQHPSRRSTVAVFGCGPTKPAPGSGTGAASDCPRHAITAWRSGSGPPCGAVRAASAGRHSWLRLSGSFLENAPLSQDTNPCTTNSIRSQ
jgi:hypothetical protein